MFYWSCSQTFTTFGRSTSYMCSDITTCRHTNLSAYLPEISFLPLPVLTLIHFTERYIQRKVMPDWILKRKDKKKRCKIKLWVSHTITRPPTLQCILLYMCCHIRRQMNMKPNYTRPPGIRATSHQSQVPGNKKYFYLRVVENYWGCVHGWLLGGHILTIKGHLTNIQPATAYCS